MTLHADTAAAPITDMITLGGGCFWRTEAVDECVKGVLAFRGGRNPLRDS
jgi:peptide methionine sulfoxide reductase MsrA